MLGRGGIVLRLAVEHYCRMSQLKMTFVMLFKH